MEEEAKERAAEEERLHLEKEAKEQEKDDLDNNMFQDVIIDDEKLTEMIEPELVEEISIRRKSVEKEAKLRLEDIEDE